MPRTFLTIDDLDEVSLVNLDRYTDYTVVSVNGVAKKIRISDFLGLDINEESDSLSNVVTINASSAIYPTGEINIYFDQAATYKIILSDQKPTITLNNAASGKTLNLQIVNSVDSEGVEWAEPEDGFTLSWANATIPTQTTGEVKSDLYTFVAIGTNIFGAQVPNFT